MESKLEKKNSAKMSTKAKEFTPTARLQKTGHEFHPSQPIQAQNLDAQQQMQANMNQMQNDQFNQGYTHYAEEMVYDNNHYDGQNAYYQQDPSQMQNFDQNLTGYNMEQHDPNYVQNDDGSYQYGTGEGYEGDQNEVASEQYHDNIQGHHRRKPQGKNYSSKNNEYEVEDGYYDDFGFYYLPDGSFYDPDGFYFDANGYDKFGGYYDENAQYHEGEVHNKPAKHSRHHDNYGYEMGGEDYYPEEEVEDKYTEDYIKFVIEQKYYENFQHLRNTANEVFYLKAGNLPTGTTKRDILNLFESKGIDIRQITVVMAGNESSPVAQLEIYRRNTAINALKCCGEYFGEKQIIIEVDESNEKYFCGGSNDYYAEQYFENDQDRYTKYDDLEIDDLNTKPAKGSNSQHEKAVKEKNDGQKEGQH